MILDRIPSREEPWDACIVGSGPVGMAVALEFDRIGRDVIVLESGRADFDPLLTEASRAVVTDPQRHAPMEIAVSRGFGGTSRLWAGRCVPFDDIDFEARAYVPHSGWPINQDDVTPWYPGAAEYLLCGNGVFHNPPPNLPATLPGISLSCQERWSTESRVSLVHRASVERSRNITVSLNSTVVDLEFGDGGRAVEGITVATDGGRSVVKARDVILAAGGVETTRLLLAVQRRWPRHFGGVDGPLGRYYMGHIAGKVANIVFDDPATAAAFDYHKDGTGAYVRRRFALSADAQRERGLLNTAFWPDNPPFHDAGHGSGVLSAIFLALAVPPVGRRLLPEAIRRYHVGPSPHHFGAHLRNVLLGAPRGSKDIVKLLRERFLAKPRKPAPLVFSANGQYALAYHAEQEPHAESRITLTAENDRYGLPRARIDLRFTDGDVRSVIGAHEVLDYALRTSGIGRLEYPYSREQLPARILAQASDGFHQAGTTRMGLDARESVVDANLKVHGLSNLHLASSSVFPTTGQANSTLVAVALGLRLVHHLCAVPAARG